MQLIQKISMDFAENGIPPKIVGKQDDSGASRVVMICLYNAGVAFEIPTGAAFMIRYKTPSGAYGLYDTMPDGSAAMAAEENRVTVQLVDQIFAAPGRVSCELRIIADGAGVSTWKWYVDVEGSNAADATIPSDYINVFSSIAAEVAANADRAEQAASAIVPEALLYKADYDPAGAVASAGGIPEYVKENSQAEPELYMTTITYANGAYVSDHTFAQISAAYNSGKICMAVYDGNLMMLMYIDTSYLKFTNVPNEYGTTNVLRISQNDEIAYLTSVFMKQDSWVTSGNVVISSNSSFGTASLVSGGWYKIGKIVTVDIVVSLNSTSPYSAQTGFDLSGIPAAAYSSDIAGFTIVANGPDILLGIYNHGTVLIKRPDGGDIANGTYTLRIRYSYIAA